MPISKQKCFLRLATATSLILLTGCYGESDYFSANYQMGTDNVDPPLDYVIATARYDSSTVGAANDGNTDALRYNTSCTLYDGTTKSALTDAPLTKESISIDALSALASGWQPHRAGVNHDTSSEESYMALESAADYFGAYCLQHHGR